MTDMTGSSSTNSTGDDNSTGDGDTSARSPLRLTGAQRRIADAYFDADSGLFVLNCVAGAGKSFTQDDIAAKELLQRWANGDRTPEQRLCVITFNRSEAASIEADIIDRLRTLVRHNLTEAAATVTQEELEELIHRVRNAPYIGTIDSVLRTVFSDIVADVGFTEPPAIGSDALLEQIHQDCYEALTSNPQHTTALQRLQDAYPETKHDDGVAALLRKAVEYCRSHQLTVTAFKTRLLTSVEAVYADGEPTSVDDITAAIARCVADDDAHAALDPFDEEDRQALLEGDRDLYHAWQDRIDEFCTLLAAYEAEYDTRTREQGVLSHLDCAYLVAEYFGDTPNSQGDVDATSQRTRVRERHRNRIESWIIDEAQDLSIIQHAALAPFITPQHRVAIAGDLRQSIYGWRDAHPELFATAVSDGTYLGIDWEPHIVETATRTYRCRPAIAAAINAITEPAVTGPARGNLGDLDIPYPHLDPVREPTDEPSVHIASFDGAGVPGTESYIAPESKKGEAEILATYIACGLADGTLSAPEPEANAPRETDDDNKSHTECDAHESTPAVTVLFRRKQHMDLYAEAFEAHGLSVVNASKPLFDCPSVQAVVDVVDWLIDPVATERTQALITDSVFASIVPADICEQHDWDIDAVLTTDTATLTDQQATILTRLRDIRDSRGIQHTYSAPELAEKIIATLELRADTYDIADHVSPAQRVANLDAFSDWLDTLHTEDTITPDRFRELVAPFRQTPQKGPIQTVTPTTTGDVEFRTIHQMKGDEAPVIVLADLGFDIWYPGPPNQRLITAGDVAALAPPETGQVPHVQSLSVFTGGLYNPAADSDSPQSGDSPTDRRRSARDVGLRWATEQWHDHEDRSVPELVGHTHLQTVSRNMRAEAWRLLYVALTRARNHLIVPLPREERTANLHDRWLDTIQAGLEYDGSLQSGYTIECPVADSNSTRTVRIGVNDVSAATGNHRTPAVDSDSAISNNSPLAGTVPATESDLQPLIPRNVRPSTFAPLISDPDTWLLNHLQNKELHTAADTAEDLPFDFGSIPPAEVGELYHGIVASVISHAVSKTSAVTDEHELRAIAKPIIDSQYPDRPQRVRRDLLSFLLDWILPQLMESDCWQRIMTADHVYIEKSVSDLIRIDGIEFEFDGAIDVVLASAEDDWEVIDLKIAFGDLLPETRDRYQLQTESYGYLLQQEVDGEVVSCVEVFGAERTTIRSAGSQGDLLECLQRLIQNC